MVVSRLDGNRRVDRGVTEQNQDNVLQMAVGGRTQERIGIERGAKARAFITEGLDRSAAKA